jgi:tRNA(fMet)-specific endonuclease VapC
MELIEAFCDRLDAVAPWDSGAVNAYTRIQRQLMQEQRVLNMNDVMIAAHALSLEARLLTQSERAFAGIAALDLQVWSE